MKDYRLQHQYNVMERLVREKDLEKFRKEPYQHNISVAQYIAKVNERSKANG